MSTAEQNQSITEAEAELISDFALFDNWVDRYQYIIDNGNATVQALKAGETLSESFVYTCLLYTSPSPRD